MKLGILHDKDEFCHENDNNNTKKPFFYALNNKNNSIDGLVSLLGNPLENA